MNKVKTIAVLLSIIFCIGIIGIFTPKVSRAIKIDYTDPKTEIVIGKDTVKIPLSVYGKNFTKEDIIYINGYPQSTSYGNEKWITCYIDVPNLEKKKNIKVYVYRESEKCKSNSVHLKLK